MRIAIISDIHEDAVSLQKALSSIDKNKVDQIVCLGDIVGFTVPYYNYYKSRNASLCIDLVKKNCSYVVAGNHDLFEVNRIPEFKAGFHYPKDWYNLSYAARKALSKQQIWLHEENSLSALLSDEDQAYLKHLPEFVVAEFDQNNILFSHFIYPDVSGTRSDFLFEQERLIGHTRWLENLNCQYSFSGHAHIEGLFMFGVEDLKKKGFGKVSIPNGMQSFIIPCIAQGFHKNGYAIYDTQTQLISTYKL